MVANIVEKMMVAFWLCTELSTTFVDMGGFFITQVEGPIPASPRGFGCAGLGSDLGTAIRITTVIRPTTGTPITVEH